MDAFLNLTTVARSATFVGILSLLLTPQIFAETEAQQPSWWKDGNPPVIKLNTPQNNKAIATVGQAKWMVSEALRALRANEQTQLADQIENDLKGPPVIVDFVAEVAANKDDAYYTKQKAPLQLGYLKALAKPFYDRLNEVDGAWVLGQLNANGLTIANTHYWTVSGNTNYTEGGHYPFDPTTPVAENKKVATIGQLKAVFALRFSTIPPDEPSTEDTDGDGLSDAYELANGLDGLNADENQNGISDGFDDFDEDGLSNLDEQLANSSASDPDDLQKSGQLVVYIPLER